MDFSLRINCKVISPKNHPRRDEQFRRIAHLRSSRPAETAVMCVDCQEKDFVGRFRNSGTAWARDAEKVIDHDFPSSAGGKAVP